MSVGGTYGLVDPRDNLFHYVGSAEDTRARFKWFLNTSNAAGATPVPVILCRDMDHEHLWIQSLIEAGHPLTNVLAGRGATNREVREWRERAALAERERRDARPNRPPARGGSAP